jgi:hypothetical protein
MRNVETNIDLFTEPEVPFVEGDIENIRDMLPKLYDHQQEDVLKVENRFKEGKGFLCTNGTGTGKTFVGLGTIKRFIAKGCQNILVVVPTETKSLDWISEGKLLDLEIYKLAGIEDKGTLYDICVTTYANYYQNEAIEERLWDLIVYDESHYLNQNAKGDETVYLMKHKNISNVPSSAKSKAYGIVGSMPEYNEDTDDYEMWRFKVQAWKNQFRYHTITQVKRTKVLFLSATPFAYHKSILYADGCLFDINEQIDPKEEDQGYNKPVGFGKFLTENFGYRMRYNKVTMPESGVDQNLLERNFFESHKEKGVMSTRILELEKDYSRHFIKVNSDVGNFINSGLEMWWDREIRDKYKYLSQLVSRQYTYLYLNQLLEAIKAKEILPRIYDHLKMRRKVVVFHGYNHSVMKHPFHFDADDLTKADEKWLIPDLEKEIEEWNAQFPEYVNLDLDELYNTRKTINDAFENAVEFNGTVRKKKRKLNIDAFNDNDSECNLIMVQSRAGREGISLHDKRGDRQRVLINLSLPVAPTEAIQTEGRIYRSGLKSHAIYEYITLHTNFEKIAFAEKIATRSKTAENLAMGNYARDLETSYKNGYINSETEPPHLEQGVGGKEFDRALNDISEFDKAKTYYYARGKKTAQNKSFEGVDYFATPEPLGMKMVEWLNPQPDERGLEPSAGHGAIGRYFPAHCRNTFVEPSLNLFSEMGLYCDGKKVNETFEEFHISNKFDFIAMNPPFGKGGKTAMEHLEKALKQLYTYSNNGSRLIAIIPAGSSMEKRFDAYFETPESKNFRYTGEILMPSCVFERAGTSAVCRVIKIEHVNTGNQYFKRVDLRYCQDPNEFFEAIEYLDF